jgi:hypothetical protein
MFACGSSAGYGGAVFFYIVPLLGVLLLPLLVIFGLIVFLLARLGDNHDRQFARVKALANGHPLPD